MVSLGAWPLGAGEEEEEEGKAVEVEMETASEESVRLQPDQREVQHLVVSEEDEIDLSHLHMSSVRDPSPSRCQEDGHKIWMVAVFHNENSSFEGNESANSPM